MTVTPKVFLIGETRVVEPGLAAYLAHIGIPGWESDALSDSEKLIEVMGRLCYRSFAPGLNPNVTKVREHNVDYIANILKTRHGSVIEHPMMNFIFADVSRVFTHELVRHRVGVGISQESLRFVRISEPKLFVPTVISEDETAMEIWTQIGEEMDVLYRDLERRLSGHFKLDESGTPFHLKKLVTSAIRRRAPDGLATAIGWSANPH